MDWTLRTRGIVTPLVVGTALMLLFLIGATAGAVLALLVI
jgi:hypothetical protein